MVLYFVLWVPGFIANIIYWREASSIERLTGRAPEGKGCLTAMLWFFILAPLIVIVLVGGLGGIAALFAGNT